MIAKMTLPMKLMPTIEITLGKISNVMTGGDLASWTAGIRAVGGNISADLGYSDIVASSLDQVDGGLFYFSASTHW